MIQNDRSRQSQAAVAHGATGGELLVALVVLSAMTVGQLFVAGGMHLLVHPPWLDECLAITLLDDPSLSHAMTALTHGGNHSPPVPILLLRPLRWVSGDIRIADIRIASAIAAILAGVGVFGILRSFGDRISALVGAASLWGMPVFIEQLYEARFYIFWLAAIAWFCFFFARGDERTARRDTIAASLLAVLVATLHWYGALVLAAIGCMDLIYNRSLRRMIPFVCGAIALACCLPVFLSQRRALVVPTWIDPLAPMQVTVMLMQLFCVLPPILAGIAAWVFGRAPASDQKSSRIVYVVAALLLLPVELVVLSLAGQPAMIARYAIACTLPLAVLCGWLSSNVSGRFARAVQTVLLIAVAVWGAAQLNAHITETDVNDEIVLQSIKDVNDVVGRGTATPVVFLRRHEMYPVIYLRPELAKSVALLNFDRGLADRADRTARFEQQMARIDHADYPQYQLIDHSILASGSHFFLIAPSQESADLREMFPGAQIRSRSPVLLEISTP